MLIAFEAQKESKNENSIEKINGKVRWDVFVVGGVVIDGWHANGSQGTALDGDKRMT